MSMGEVKDEKEGHAQRGEKNKDECGGKKKAERKQRKKEKTA